MFGFLKKEKKEIALYSPVNGKSIDLSSVPDKIFSQKMLGDGVAFTFDDDTIYAPCDGKITMVANTSHAFGMTASNGAEILIHIGMDTVSLEGNGFSPLVTVGDKVKTGTPVIKLDRALLNKSGVDLTTPMIISNIEEHPFEIEISNQDVHATTDLVIRFL